jgi:hypothetical protein
VELAEIGGSCGNAMFSAGVLHGVPQAPHAEQPQRKNRGKHPYPLTGTAFLLLQVRSEDKVACNGWAPGKPPNSISKLTVYIQPPKLASNVTSLLLSVAVQPLSVDVQPPSPVALRLPAFGCSS